MFAPLLEKLARRIDLTTEETADAMAAIMDGRAQPSQIAALLVPSPEILRRPEQPTVWETALRPGPLTASEQLPR